MKSWFQGGIEMKYVYIVIDKAIWFMWSWKK